MTSACQAKWDRASRTYDWFTWGDERRFGPAKTRLFRKMTGRCLMVAAGTGNDFRYFPPDLTITAVDRIPVGLTGKYEEFVCEVSADDRPRAEFAGLVRLKGKP